MVLRYTLCWFALVAIAVANGALREGSYGNYLTELHAHQLSTAAGILFTGLFIGFLSRRWPLASASQAWTIGRIWLLMTVAFEFLFGHYVAGHSWTRLFQDYNVFAGRLWLPVLIWITVAPYLFYRWGK